jgi:uncharacterized protein (UPF0332 family)
MAFPDDLLNDAFHLAARGGKNPKQSSLRRAVSTAYYALFHLLIADFVLNWKPKDQRVRLGRMFEHSKMRNASFKPENSSPTPVEADLLRVVKSFAMLQDDRHAADYDVAKDWTRADVMITLTLAADAFKAWKSIRKEKTAQDHLLTMFGARRV